MVVQRCGCFICLTLRNAAAMKTGRADGEGDEEGRRDFLERINWDGEVMQCSKSSLRLSTKSDRNNGVQDFPRAEWYAGSEKENSSFQAYCPNSTDWNTAAGHSAHSNCNSLYDHTGECIGTYHVQRQDEYVIHEVHMFRRRSILYGAEFMPGIITSARLRYQH